MLKGAMSNYEFDSMLMERFEQFVKESPESTAVIDQGKIYTYSKLNNQANKIAHTLLDKGVNKNVIVGIMMDRSFEMISAIFGVWKAGGAYLPIDRNWPNQRKKDMIKDSGLDIILIYEETDGADLTDVTFISVNSTEVNSSKIYNPMLKNCKEDLAYVIYTSGSTGVPKGVMVGHEALINRIMWMQQEFSIGKGDIILHKTVYTFDVSVWEIVWWAVTGAGVCLLPSGKESSIKTIIQYIEKYHINIIHFVPYVYKLYLEYIETDFDLRRIDSIRYYFASGEALSSEFVKEFNNILINGNLDSVLVNLYGPTEAAIDTSFYICNKDIIDDEIPIGRPIDNTYLYVMDESLHDLPVGEKGLLFIGGTGLAWGYLNRKELTNKTFIEDPYNPGYRIYNTGDLAMYREDKNVLYCGREDEQVKIRGIRIELGEIEYHLCRYKGVKESVVLCTESVEIKILIAFIVIKDEMSIDPNEVKTYLSKYLPNYMIPSFYYLIKNVPLKANGKLDKQQLLELVTKEKAI